MVCFAHVHRHRGSLDHLQESFERCLPRKKNMTRRAKCTSKSSLWISLTAAVYAPHCAEAIETQPTLLTASSLASHSVYTTVEEAQASQAQACGWGASPWEQALPAWELQQLLQPWQGQQRGPCPSGAASSLLICRQTRQVKT